MPRARRVVIHVRSYNRPRENSRDTTALRRGGSRSELSSNKREAARRQARGIFRALRQSRPKIVCSFFV